MSPWNPLAHYRNHYRKVQRVSVFTHTFDLKQSAHISGLTQMACISVSGLSPNKRGMK